MTEGMTAQEIVRLDGTEGADSMNFGGENCAGSRTRCEDRLW
jgi:hypothetical protein